VDGAALPPPDLRAFSLTARSSTVSNRALLSRTRALRFSGPAAAGGGGAAAEEATQ
jgi:hypothetical protein